MILEILGKVLASVKTCLELGVGNVACHDDGTLEAHTCTHWVLGQFSTYGVNTLVKVNFNTLAALARVAQFFRNEF